MLHLYLQHLNNNYRLKYFLSYIDSVLSTLSNSRIVTLDNRQEFTFVTVLLHVFIQQLRTDL